jgi:YegS/Rv2252/BmrU family lipid kinase
MIGKRLLLLVNPHGGRRRGKAILEQVLPIFTAAATELDVRVTEQHSHARTIARETDLAQYDGLCLIGGDGTVHEVVSGLIEQDKSASVPIGIIPGGTGNDVTRHLGIKDPIDAARRIVSGRTNPFDVMRIEADGQTDYCITVIGWTGVADVNSKAERLRLLGPPRYAVASLWQLMIPRRRRAKLVLDNQLIEDQFLLVAACNTRFTGSGMQLTPRATSDDGLMDVVIVRNATRWQLLRLFTKTFDGSHVEMPCVESFQVRTLSILSDDCGPLDLDGEVKGTTPVSIQVLPGAVKFYV